MIDENIWHGSGHATISTREEDIAAFAALANASSSSSSGRTSSGHRDEDYDDDECDDDSSLLIFAADDDDDNERLGLLTNDDDGRGGRGRRRLEEEAGTTNAHDDVDGDEEAEEKEEENDDGITVESPSSTLLVVAGTMRANPRWSMFATLLVLAAAISSCLMMSGVGRNENVDYDCDEIVAWGDDGRHHVAPRGKTTKSKSSSFPSFPARTLLGIKYHGGGGEYHSNRASSSSSSSSSSISLSTDSSSTGMPPYDPTSDFRYEKHGTERILTYWEEVVAAIDRNDRHRIEDDDDHDEYNGNGVDEASRYAESWANIAYWGPCHPRPLAPNDGGGWIRGPSRGDKGGTDWSSIVRINTDLNDDDDDDGGGKIVYPTVSSPPRRCGGGGQYASSSDRLEDLAGLCRPGFLIIGQGKCGTSSLYHYITGHPRVLPAKQKQIDYFRYQQGSMPRLSWYYSNFPSIESFLGRGALMTGEASPGYMPYPNVVESVVRRLSPIDWRPYGSTGNDRDGAEAWKARVRSLPKIIAIVREPIDRARSSYKYNYVMPALARLRAGKGITVSGRKIPSRMTDEYYRSTHLFSFEELAYAELAALKECLESGGRGERWTYDELGASSDMFFYESLQRRNRINERSRDDDPPLVFLDEACYSDSKHYLVPRTQWKQIAVEHPNKTLVLPNLQLIQSIVGRGVYALPLEWWYEVFSNATAANGEEGIHVVCTEDLANDAQAAMADVTRFLGLPFFDFTNITELGRYNVDGNQGYDAVTKSHDDDDADVNSTDAHSPSHQGSWSTDEDAVDPLLTISDALMHALDHFYRPYNERLFRLIAKRCPWG